MTWARLYIGRSERHEGKNMKTVFGLALATVLLAGCIESDSDETNNSNEAMGEPTLSGLI